MNRRHPIDDLFRRQLKNHSVEPPMHIWERIEESRRRSLVPAIPYRLPVFLIAACTFLALLIPQSEWRPAQHNAAFPTAETADLLHRTNAKNTGVGAEVSLAAIPERNAPAGSLYAPAIPTPSAPSLTLEAGEQPAASVDAIPDAAKETPHQGAGLADGITDSDAGFAYTHWSTEKLPTGSNLKLLSRARAFPDASKCASFKHMGLRFHLELTASPDAAFRQMEGRSADPTAESYAQMRERTEQPFYNYSFGARVSASTRFGLTLRSGLNYSQINERIRYVTETEERFTIINIIGPGGNITGIDTIYESIEREHTIQNSYRTLDIPLLAGYEFPIKRWLLSAHGGAYINMLFRQQGSMYLPGGDTPVRFATVEQEGSPVFRNRLGVGWYAGAGVAYKIRHNLQIMAEPHLRAYPKSFTTDQFAVRQSYLQGGLSLGLRYQI